MKQIVGIFTLLLFAASVGFAQQNSDSTTVTKRDLSDLFSNIPKVETEVVPAEKVEVMKLYMPILPLVGYMPANGFIIGAAALPSICLDSIENTRMSSMMANIQITSKKQVNFNVRSNIYLSHDKWILQGDWRFLFYSQSTYGLGIYDYPPELLDNPNAFIAKGEQPMRFNYLRLYQKGYRQLVGKLYGGLGIAFDLYDQIKDQTLSLDSLFFTSHYLYSTKYGYATTEYRNLGLTFNLLFDNRDNSMTPYAGSYLDLSYRVNPNIFIDREANSKILIDLRKYIKIYEGNNPHILGLWILGDLQISGYAPYLTLPSVGWDTYNRSGRGFVQGRYRGDDLLYAESEYRFPITRDGLLGGVAFVNGLTVSSSVSHQALLNNWVFGYGGGLRLKVNKLTRVNLCVDFAVGPQKEGLFFFGLQEVF